MQETELIKRLEFKLKRKLSLNENKQVNEVIIINDYSYPCFINTYTLRALALLDSYWGKYFKPYFQPGPLSNVLTILHLRDTATMIYTWAEPQFWLYFQLTKLHNELLLLSWDFASRLVRKEALWPIFRSIIFNYI